MMTSAPAIRPRWRVAGIVLVAMVISGGLSGCQVARAGTRCRTPGATAQDARYVLLCQKGRWVRSMTKETAARFLLAIIADSRKPVAVAVGGGHACAVTKGGQVLCWGANDAGQLGDGTRTDRHRPIVVGGLPNGAGVVTGNAFTCMTVTTHIEDYHADMWCWGDNSSGQLGDGTTEGRTTPHAIPHPRDFGFFEPSAGGAHICAGNLRDEIECWGEGSSGELGDGTASDYAFPVVIPNEHRFFNVAAGRAHTCASEFDLQQIKCFGDNTYGQLGDGTTTSRAVPTTVVSTAAFVYYSIAAGAGHTCAVGSVGYVMRVYCWGANDHGQLGDGTTISRTTPVMIDLATSQLALGDRHSCAINSAGAVLCWGANDHGQLGDATATDRSAPTTVAGMTTTSSLSTGGDSTCAITGGHLYCWGRNDHGQLGDGSTVDRSAPTEVHLLG